MKDVRSQGGLSSADKGGEGVLQMRTPHFLAQKPNLSKFIVYSHG